MVLETYTVKIAGPAGAGIKSSGLLLSKILLRHGFNVRDYSEYPSLVRGGHNTYQVSFSQGNIYAPYCNVDYFFSLVPGHWQQHESEFSKKTLVFGDDAALALPLKEFSAQLGASIYANTICLGVVSYLLNLDLVLCQKIVEQQFGADSPNVAAFDLGVDYAAKNYEKYRLKAKSYITTHKNNQNIYDGNEAYGWGFLQGGGNFFASYPMTPASGALHFLAGKQAEYRIQVVHPEDEIAAASLAAGAVFAGARAATGTSGGGFALMTESISFCGAANLGAVFYLVSRPGPATGLPTWTSQGDLLFAVNSGHGEFIKIVLAPGDQEESFEFGYVSLNLAAKFNVPVIVLSDKFISESASSLTDLSQKKVKIVGSNTPIPGTPGKEFMANSYEHDDEGFAIEDAPTIIKNADNRKKLQTKILKFLPKPIFYGSENAKRLILSWGSTKSTILEALKLLNDPSVAFLQIRSMWPINPNLQFLLAPFKEIIVVENNATSQLTSLLKSQFNFNPHKTILRYDGRPFFPEDLLKELTEVEN